MNEHSVYFSGGHLNRASWLRGSDIFLNSALQSNSTRFILLDCGNPLVYKTDARRKRVWLARWSDICSAVLASVPRPERGVFGANANELRINAQGNHKEWKRCTDGIITPMLSLAFLGIDESQDAPSFPSDPGLHVLKGTPYFVLSLSYQPAHTPTTPCQRLRDALAESYDTLDMRFAVAFGLLQPEETATIGAACSLIDWNERFKYCTACGSKQYSAQSGHKRICGTVLACFAEPCAILEVGGRASAQDCVSWRTLQNYTFPRIDSVVLVGIVDAVNAKILLARKKGWPKGFYSCIAYVCNLTLAGLLNSASQSRRLRGGKLWKKRAWRLVA